MTASESPAYRRSVSGTAMVVHARGDLDALTAPAFRAALLAAVQERPPLLVVDLLEVSFLDSAGLAVIFGVQRHLDVDQRLVLGNVPERMLRTLRLSGVASVVHVHAQGRPQPWREAVDPVH